MNPTTSGAAAEHMAAALLSSAGWNVFWPLDTGCVFDLLIERSGEYLKVQVKRASWHHVGGRTNKSLVVRADTRDPRGVRRLYKQGDFDLLAAIDGTRMWLIPFVECSTRRSLTLDHKGISRDKGYEPTRWLVK